MNTQSPTGKIRLNQTQPNEAAASFLDQMIALKSERQAAIAAGLPALQRLIVVAERDSGQSATVRRFLLGLYNGHAHPFNLISLRGLDKALFDDVVAVLTLDARVTTQEIHHYLPDCDALFESWARMGGVK